MHLATSLRVGLQGLKSSSRINGLRFKAERCGQLSFRMYYAVGHEEYLSHLQEYWTASASFVRRSPAELAGVFASRYGEAADRMAHDLNIASKHTPSECVYGRYLVAMGDVTAYYEMLFAPGTLASEPNPTTLSESQGDGDATTAGELCP
jgi:hypothetical protein